MTIKFCGAAREVTGSCHLLTLDNGYKILLDCGLYQGKNDNLQDFNRTWLFEPTSIDCMILSHAHTDHTGRIPQLVKDGFKGRIYCTAATRDLAAMMMLDSSEIQEADAKFHQKKNINHPQSEPLYTVNDARNAVKQLVAFNYHQWFRIADGVEVFFTDAGHILGSASVTMRILENGETKMFGFTGDIGRPNRPILRDPEAMPEVQYLITESTYGDKLHHEKPDENNRLLEILTETCIKNKGKVIIPAFSVGRTQELVHAFDTLQTKGLLPPIPVYVDSPLAIDATDVFINHPECFDDTLHDYMLRDPNPFGFKSLTFIRDVAASKALNTSSEPCIIIASSGMANAGRVRHHIYNNIENERNTILIVGYCSPNTLGGQLREGKKEVFIFEEKKQVKARVERLEGFSAHGDRDELIAVLQNQQPHLEKLFLVHGEYETQQKFQATLLEKGFRCVEIPELGECVKL